MGWSYSALRGLVVTWFRVYNRLRVEGLENIPRTGPVLLAPNHRSFLDSVVIPVAVPRRVRFLAKSDYFTGTGLRGLWNRMFFGAVAAIPLPRDVAHDAKVALQIAQDCLAEGDAFGIYPEGTRSRDGRLYRGRTGVAWLALETGVSIVPVGIIGTARAQPIGSTVVRPFRVTVRFGAPIPVEAVAHLTSPGQQRRVLTDMVMDEVAALCGQERVDRYNTSPTRE